MADRVGQRVRIILMGNFHYSGKILDEDENSIKILDKFGSEVTLAKSNIVVLEVISNGKY